MDLGEAMTAHYLVCFNCKELGKTLRKVASDVYVCGECGGMPVVLDSRESRKVQHEDKKGDKRED